MLTEHCLGAEIILDILIHDATHRIQEGNIFWTYHIITNKTERDKRF